VERHLIRPMRATVELLEEVVRSWIVDSEGESSDRKIPEVDWGKMKFLDFQETLQDRRVLEMINRDRSCLLCSDFGVHVSSFRLHRNGSWLCVCELSRPSATVVTNHGLSVFSMRSSMVRRCCKKRWPTSEWRFRTRTWS